MTAASEANDSGMESIWLNQAEMELLKAGLRALQKQHESKPNIDTLIKNLMARLDEAELTGPSSEELLKVLAEQ